MKMRNGAGAAATSEGVDRPGLSMEAARGAAAPLQGRIDVQALRRLGGARRRAGAGRSENEIAAILREAAEGVPVRDLCRRHGISDSTFYRWRLRYGAGVRVSAIEARLRSLAREVRLLRLQRAGAGR